MLGFSLMSFLVFTRHFEMLSRVRGISKWAGKIFDFSAWNWDSHMTFLLVFFYCRSTIFGLSFHSKIARNSIIWANLGPLQSCLFYHLDTISFPMNNRVCIVLSKSNISCMGTWGTDWLCHLDTSTLNYTFSAVCSPMPKLKWLHLMLGHLNYQSIISMVCKGLIHGAHLS